MVGTPRVYLFTDLLNKSSGEFSEENLPLDKLLTMSYYEAQKKHNKYKQEPDLILDFHGMTTAECKEELDLIVNNKVVNSISHIRIIVGKGTRSQNGPVLPDFVRNYLTTHNIRFSQSKIQDGGEGALEVYLAG